MAENIRDDVVLAVALSIWPQLEEEEGGFALPPPQPNASRIHRLRIPSPQAVPLLPPWSEITVDGSLTKNIVLESVRVLISRLVATTEDTRGGSERWRHPPGEESGGVKIFIIKRYSVRDGDDDACSYSLEAMTNGLEIQCIVWWQGDEGIWVVGSSRKGSEYRRLARIRTHTESDHTSADTPLRPLHPTAKYLPYALPTILAGRPSPALLGIMLPRARSPGYSTDATDEARRSRFGTT
ncbi:hypothetical protein IW261DRAFT_1570591 [Armillaria novae-zelandiae]|uniref:Uncharacterized protein n=1 Tax=Armillaria novae-zelandiae TaxID=153914 RepID=A0AA39NVQ1_9AGAR|nr:hypothetical protein IW261DRAFT_1570591 [Armillaria novae-zelandiae]